MRQILPSLRKLNENIIITLQTQLKQARSRRNELRKILNSDRLTFEIDIVSLWKDDDYGRPEKDVTLSKLGSLQKLIKEAEVEFKRINSRSDVQATYRVWVIFKNGTRLPLADEVWQKLCERH